MAQPSGGQPVSLVRNTQFLYTNGKVVQRVGKQITPLAKNVRLPNGTKINVRSGIVELPTGKITTLREGDYVNAEGGIVKFDPYVHVGTAPARALSDAPTDREQLLMRKIELLNRKVELLNQSVATPPDMSAVDKQIQELDAQIKTAKRD
jgi:hypothetical protein